MFAILRALCVGLAFDVAVAVVTVLCLVGHGSVVNSFLSAKAWRPLSKLTYSMYLVHPLVIQVVYNSSDNLIYYRSQLTHAY